jgi:hypothetical protein
LLPIAAILALLVLAVGPTKADSRNELRSIKRLEGYFESSKLNITYLPVEASSPEHMHSPRLAVWALDHYDYPRARYLLHNLSSLHFDGPHLVTVLEPLNAGTSVRPYLFQLL